MIMDLKFKLKFLSNSKSVCIKVRLSQINVVNGCLIKSFEFKLRNRGFLINLKRGGVVIVVGTLTLFRTREWCNRSCPTRQRAHAKSPVRLSP